MFYGSLLQKLNLMSSMFYTKVLKEIIINFFLKWGYFYQNVIEKK